jgi:hypothetical protein
VKNLARAAAVSLAAVALAAPAAAHAAGTSAAINDPVGDVVAMQGTKATPSADMVAAADIAKVTVKAKKSNVIVVVHGTDFQAPAETNTGFMASVDLGTNSPYYRASSTYYSAGVSFVEEGFMGDCGGGAYNPTANTMKFVIPRSCLGKATKITEVNVFTSGYDLNGSIAAPTEDKVEKRKNISLPRR